MHTSTLFQLFVALIAALTVAATGTVDSRAVLQDLAVQRSKADNKLSSKAIYRRNQYNPHATKTKKTLIPIFDPLHPVQQPQVSAGVHTCFAGPSDASVGFGFVFGGNPACSSLSGTRVCSIVRTVDGLISGTASRCVECNTAAQCPQGLLRPQTCTIDNKCVPII